MKQVKKILAPVDLSKSSRAGLGLALSLAAENAAELLVLHVAGNLQAWQMLDENGFSDRIYKWEVDRIVREAALDLHRFLEPHMEEIRRLPSARQKVVLGDAAEKIVEVACGEESGLIVMSPRPYGPLRRFFAGSATDQVARRAPCPVLSVCPAQVPRAGRGRRIPRVPLIGGILQGSEA